MSIYWLTSICCHPQSALATHIPATNRKTCLLHTRALIFACKYVQLQIRMQFPHLSHWLILIIKNLAEFIASSWHNTSTFTRANLRATTHQAYVPPHTAAVVHVFEYDYWIFISQLKALPAPPPVSAAALEEGCWLPQPLKCGEPGKPQKLLSVILLQCVWVCVRFP